MTAALLAASAPAGPSTLAWSTYLRAGPGETFAAIRELEHDARIDVLGCSARWCRVSDGRTQGFVDRDALDLARLRQPAPPGRSDCVIVGQVDDRRPMPTRFCQAGK